MKLTFDRRYEDKWEQLREDQLRCERCMQDAPYEYCCKNYCGKHTWCEGCEAECKNGAHLCEK
jgi:hypothetical protein